MLKFLLFFMLLGLSTMAPAATNFTVKDYSRHLELIGVVSDNALDLANKINDLSIVNNKEITILINSPGGSVVTGMIMVDSMRQAKERGVTFRCLSTVLSASMAYIILAECNERYAFNNTLLLWHEISLSVRGAKIRDLYNSLPPLLELQDRVDADLMNFMNINNEFYQKHSHAETMWSAAELNKALKYNKFINIIDRADFKTKNLYKFLQDDPFGLSIGFDSVQRILDRMKGLN